MAEGVLETCFEFYANERWTEGHWHFIVPYPQPGLTRWCLLWIHKAKISTLLLIFAGAAFCVWIKTTTHAPSLSSTLCCVFLRGATPAHPNRTNSIAPPTQRLGWPAWHFRPTSKLYSYFCSLFLGLTEYVRRPRLVVRARWNSQTILCKIFNRESRNLQPEEKFIKRPLTFVISFVERENQFRHWNLFLSTKETIE